MRRTTLGFVAGVLVAAALGAAQESALLTHNGAARPGAAVYAAAPRLDTGGVYEPRPAFSGGDGGAGSVPFAAGALTDGDPRYDSKTQPAPYAYWQGKPQAELVLRLGRPCRLDRLRIHVLNSGGKGPHGTAHVDVFVTGNPLEFPEVLRVGRIAPTADGWNELAVGRAADGLRLVFQAQPGKAYITLSEIEVWGQPLSGAAAQAPAPAATASPRRVQDGIAWWAFDFGPADSPSFAEFFVCDAHAVYSPEKGFGWVPYRDGQPMTESNFGPASSHVPGLAERDRGAKSGGIDRLFRDFVMTSEYYHTQVRQTFVVDLPNGAYRVMTCHGDTHFGRAGRQAYWVEAEGRRVAAEIELPRGLTTDRVFDVTVADGRLDLTLDAAADEPAKRGFVLNALVILPAGTDAERAFAERTITQVRAAVQRQFEEDFAARFREVPYVETAAMATLAPADVERGFVAWTPNWMSLIYPNSVPTDADRQRPLSAFATPGEAEPVAVAFRALRALGAVRLTVTDLQSPQGGHIPAAAVEVRRVRCWPQRLGSSWSTEWRIMPELLELMSEAAAREGETREFWLTVRVPVDAKPGHYAGAVRLAAESGPTWETTLTLEVLPYTLGPPERVIGMYWRETAWPREILERQVRDMAAHGITAVTLAMAPKVANAQGELAVDAAALRALLVWLRGLGMRGPIPYNNDLQGPLKRAFPDGDFPALYARLIGEMEKLSTDAAALKLLYYPVDEIGNDEERGRKAQALCGLVAKVPGATSYITVNNYAAGERWGDTFDIWCGNIEYTLEQEQRLLASGKRYMRYGSAYLNDCRKARNSSGFGFYRRPAEAMYYWHYQAFNGDPFNDFDGEARDWCAAYPGDDGMPIPTLDWESIREGIDDLRTIATLKALAAQAVAGTANQKAAAAAARAELQAVLSLEPDTAVNQYTYGQALSHDDFSGLRRRLADRIVALQNALGQTGL